MSESSSEKNYKPLLLVGAILLFYGIDEGATFFEKSLGRLKVHTFTPSSQYQLSAHFDELYPAVARLGDRAVSDEYVNALQLERSFIEASEAPVVKVNVPQVIVVEKATIIDYMPRLRAISIDGLHPGKGIFIDGEYFRAGETIPSITLPSLDGLSAIHPKVTRVFVDKARISAGKQWIDVRL